MSGARSKSEPKGLLRHTGLAAFALSAVVLCVGHQARPARADVVDRIVAVVNQDIILLSDLRERATPFLSQVFNASTKNQQRQRFKQLYERLLKKLIDEELIRQKARGMGVRVSQQDIDRAIGRVQKRSGLEGQQFWSAVRREGLTKAQYRRDLRKQLLRLKVLNRRVRGRVNITEEDVRRRYEQRLRKANRKLRFHASHCFLSFPEGGSATEVVKVRKRARKTRKGLTPDGFTQCVSAHGGGDLGWLSQGDLPKPLEEALLTLRPGEISKPVRGSSGYHIFLLHDRERGGSNLPPYEKMRQKLFRKMLDKAMARQEKQFLQELRRKALVERRL